jgi:hypothetical protein
MFQAKIAMAIQPTPKAPVKIAAMNNLLSNSRFFRGALAVARSSLL